MKFKTRPIRLRRGFALIVTLSLMILLTVIAVGLLSLSSIALRTTGEGDAMAKARANAKLALMLAIGDLQKAAGPDKAVTATSEIVAANPGKPNLTGVWDSWDYDVRSSNLDYDGAKTRKSDPTAPGFKGWLVSDPDVQNSASREYVNAPLADGGIELVGKASLGDSAADADKVKAGKVALTKNGKKTGNYAWHVADESVKARINTYRDSGSASTLSQRRALLAGHRPDISVIQSKGGALDFLPDDSKDYAGAVASTGKMLDLNQAGLFKASPSSIQTVKSLRNDVTPYSLGLLTNVREGGLKQDLTSLFEMATNGTTGTTGLPSAFSGKKVFQTSVFSGGAAVTGSADPYWTALAGYYNVYKELVSPEGSPKLYKSLPVDIPIPTAVQPLPTQPQQFSPAPVIVKVELLFSLLCRDKHGPWKSNPGDYELHLLYIPIFTIHNPYNVSLQFDRMKVGLSGVPIGFSFIVNGQAKNAMTPLSNLFSGQTINKEFWMELANWPSATATSPTASIVMNPGQTMIFGPYINTSEAFMDNNASYFDYGGNLTGTKDAPLKSKRGFSGASVGFDLDWLNGGLINVNKADKIAVQFKSTAPGTVAPFNVTATLTNKNVTRSYGGMNFTYGNQAILDKILSGTFRYPKTDGIVAQTMYASNNTQCGSITQGKAFALFSAYARTANGGVDATGARVAAVTTSSTAVPAVLPDGRLAGNPFLHNNAARPIISSDFTKEKPGAQSHELNLVSLNGTVDDTFSIAADFRTNGLLNYKQVSGRSIKSGTYLEIPSGPLQAIADFRRSNALASPFLPAFVQPIGNSYASPLIATNAVQQTGVASYTLLDQSLLANHALYDRTYFSTFAQNGTVSASDGFSDFMDQGKSLRTQIFQGYLPSGATTASAKSELFAGNKPAPNAYKLAAQYQMVKGAFNVNSTRVQAWKAMLSSMNRTTLLTLWPKNGLFTSAPCSATPIPSMTLVNGSSTTGSFAVGNTDDAICNEWNGYREFSDADIDKLANEIVNQVRLRGPFQSMSEFVNRRIGADSDLTRMGALQNAIDESKLNDPTYSEGRVTVRVNESDLSNANLYGFKTPKAAIGNPAAGAPGWLSQADLLKILEPAATVRSDTFVVRACGEATDGSGNVVAKAYAEAVVQRIPEYLDPSDPPTAKAPNPNAPGGSSDSPNLNSRENIAFGRRFVMVSFKWLAPGEI